MPSPCEPLHGHLGTILSSRFTRLPAEERAQACAATSEAESVATAARLLHGVRPRILQEHDTNVWVYYALDSVVSPNSVRDTVIDHTNRPVGLERIALVTALPTTWPSDVDLATRERLLLATLQHAHVAVGTIDQWVRQPRGLHNPFASMAVVLWWEARMAQGYTVEAACTLLSLMVDRHRLADVEALLADTFEND